MPRERLKNADCGYTRVASERTGVCAIAVVLLPARRLHPSKGPQPSRDGSARASAISRTSGVGAKPSSAGARTASAAAGPATQQGTADRGASLVRSDRCALGDRLLRGAPHDLWGRGHRHVLVAQRVGNCVDDGGRPRDRARFTAALEAKRVGRAGVSTVSTLKEGRSSARGMH
jgi:hypothetical protein